MEIAEFLLARITEDEERGRSLVAQWYDVGNACQSCGTDGARVLAECEAKRQVVEDMSFYWREYPEGLAARELADRTLTRLALPYAEHPDYRQEWRA